MPPDDENINRRRGQRQTGSNPNKEQKKEGEKHAPSAATPEQDAAGLITLKAEVKVAVEAARTATNKQEATAKLVHNLSTPNNDVNKHLTDKANKDGSYTDKLPGNTVKGTEDTIKYKAYLIHATISHVIDAYTDDQDLIPVKAGEPSRYVIDKLIANINTSKSDDKGLTEKNTSYIQRILEKALDESLKEDNLLSDALTKEQWDALYRIDPAMYNKVHAAVLEAAKDAGVAEEKRKVFEQEDVQRKKPAEKKERGKREREVHTPEEEALLAEFNKHVSDLLARLDGAPPERAATRTLIRTFISTFQDDPKARAEFKKFAIKKLPTVIPDPADPKKYEVIPKIDLDDEKSGYGLNISEEKFEQYLTVISKSMADFSKEDALDKQALEAYNLKEADFAPLSALTIGAQLKLATDESVPKTNKYFEKTKEGEVVLTEFGKKEMSRAVYITVNKLLGKITSTMNVEWRSLWDPLFEGRLERTIEYHLFTTYQSPEILGAIRDIVGDKPSNQYLVDNSIAKYIEYIRGLRVQFQNEKSTRQNYFELRNHIIKGTANPEQMAGFAKNFPAHTKEALFKGESGFLFQLALCEFQTDIQSRMAMNNNQIPADIFGSYFNENGEMDTPDLRRVRDRLWQKIERIKMMIRTDENIKRQMLEDPVIAARYNSLLNTQLWEIERALILAPGFSLVDSMRSLEIVAQGARRTDFKGLFNFAQYITIIGKWRIARGRQEDNSGGFEIGELFDIAIRTNKEEKPLMERIMERGWVPREVYERSEPGKRKNIDKLIHQFDNMINDIRQQEGDSFEKKFEDAFRDFALLGFYSRTGWRIAGFNKWYGDQEEAIKKDIDKKDISDSQKSKEKEDVGTVQFKYKYIREQVGAAACWFFDAGRASGDAKGYVLKRILGPDYKTRYEPDQLDQIFNSYHEGHEKEKKVVLAQGPHGHTEAMTVEEFIEEKRLVYKGMNFKALMERSPYDFMLIMNQLEPKLNQLVTKGSHKYSCYEYYFTDAVPKNQSEELGKLKFIQSLKTKWGDENIDHIKRVAKIWHDTYCSGLFYKKGYINDEGVTISGNHRPGDAIDNVDTDKAQGAMYDVMTFALTQVKVRHKGRMTGEDFLVKDDSETDLKANKDFIEQSKFFRELFIGDAGLLAHFDKEAEKFGDKKGEELSLGSEGFFARWSKVWEMQMGKNMFPSTNDLLEGFIFEKIDEAGPDVFVRLWGDLNGWNKAVDTLITLDHKLFDAAEAHKLDPIYAIHKEIKSLEGMIGKRGAQKHNRQIAFLVARYFQTDWRTRLPAPFNKLAGDLYLGKDVALSTLHGEITSMKMNSGAIHDYLHHMVTEGYIDEEDMEIILENVGADLQKFMAVTGAPSILILGAAFIIGAILVKTIKEVTGGKK